jgi:acetyl-CoA carboxylase biotin carboxyl carrier protein
MEVRELKTLLALMQDFGLVELEIEDKKGKVRLVRAGVAASATATPPAAIAGPKEIAAKAFELRTAKEASKPAENQKLVVSPMVGTFYRAASPDSDPFVEEGDSVRKGQALCIIEAMKMMNEIEADAGGRIVRILCENGQPIEYGQPLMVLEIG